MKSEKIEPDFQLNLDNRDFETNDEQLLLKLKEAFPEKISFQGDFRKKIPEILFWLKECGGSKTITFIVSVTGIGDNLKNFSNESLKDRDRHEEWLNFLSVKQIELIDKYHKIEELFKIIENRFARKISGINAGYLNIKINFEQWNVIKAISEDIGVPRSTPLNRLRDRIATKNSKVPTTNEEIVQKLNKYEQDINSVYNELAKQEELLLNIEVPAHIVIQFLIEKLKTIEKYIDTSSVNKIFHENVEEAKNKWWENRGYVIITICILFLLNLWVFLLNPPFAVKSLSILVIEVILFKLLFFFFDRYSSYSKIEFLYNYYISLLEADKIYTADTNFRQEQNFILREKTYSEITKLSANIVWLIDKKSIESVSDVVSAVKEISPFLKSVK